MGGVGVAAVEVVARERVEPLSTELNQAAARTQRGPPPLGIRALTARSTDLWASHSAAQKALADTQALSRTATTIILHRSKAGARARTLTTLERHWVAAVVIASRASHPKRVDRSSLQAKARARTSPSHLAGAVRMRRESRHPASHPSRARHPCPVRLPSPERRPNRVSPRPINPDPRVRAARTVRAARRRVVQRSHTLSGPPPRRTIVATIR